MALLAGLVWFASGDAGGPATVAPASPAATSTAATTPADAVGEADPARPEPTASERLDAARAEVAPPERRVRVEFVDESFRPIAPTVVVAVDVLPEARDSGAHAPESTEIQGARLDLAAPSASGTGGTAADAPARVRVVARARGLFAETIVPIVPAEPARFERVVLRATTIVRGTIVDRRGDPVEGVEVHVRDDVPGIGSHARARTDAAGTFEFEALPDRANRVFVGDPAYPWTRPFAVDATAGPRTLDPIVVDLHAATFVVQRADGVPARGARIEGIGLEGGRFVATIDDEGRARVTTLLPGRWRVNAAHPEHGRANRAVEIPLEKDEPVLLLLPR